MFVLCTCGGMVDTYALGAYVERRASSSLAKCTKSVVPLRKDGIKEDQNINMSLWCRFGPI